MGENAKKIINLPKKFGHEKYKKASFGRISQR